MSAALASSDSASGPESPTGPASSAVAEPAAVWPANLAVLRRFHTAFAAELEAADRAGPGGACTLSWEASRAGPEVASRPGERGPLALASRFDPEAEATRSLAALDDAEVATVVVLGLGLGHVASLATRRLSGAGLVLGFEPDLRQFAAVLRRLDATGWLGHASLRLFGPGADRAELSAALQRSAVPLTQGTRLVVHPVTRRLHPEAVDRFGADVAAVTAAARTNLATAMVHAARTSRNLGENLPVYAAGGTTEPLRNAAAGRTAVCVAAGPSLARNADLLRDPASREAVVLIAAQTALRPLLDRGVRPDFVTALDHSAACARFYENLPALPEVTLVAEPTANPVILRGFPGPVRLARGEQADAFLGARLVEERAAPSCIPPGTTVAHLSVSLAEFLGCTTVVLVGQDLGFSDGLYYCPGTAVHRVWEAELSPWNTLEAMEWQRIARMRGTLERRAGVAGRPCLTDGQMATYLQQFEREFARMHAAGVEVIDATEGGLAKAHTEAVPLAEALRSAREAVAEGPALPEPPPEALPPQRLTRLRARLVALADEVTTLRATCGAGIAVLDRMEASVGRAAVLAREDAKLRALKARVAGELADAMALVSRVNVTGSVRRQRADGKLRRSGAEGDARLRLELARDRDHLDWLSQACEQTTEVLRRARESTDAALDAAGAAP